DKDSPRMSTIGHPGSRCRIPAQKSASCAPEILTAPFHTMTAASGTKTITFLAVLLSSVDSPHPFRCAHSSRKPWSARRLLGEQWRAEERQRTLPFRLPHRTGRGGDP